MEMTKKRTGGSRSLFPSLMIDFFGHRLFEPGFFDIDEVFGKGVNNIPLANIVETKNDYRIELCIPGFDKNDFRLNVENGVLTISSEKKEERKEEEENYRRREFSYEGFSRSFQLPENVTEDKINAKYDNGLLQVTVPKKEVSVSKAKKMISVS